MRNVTQFFRDSDEFSPEIFGVDSMNLAKFARFRPFYGVSVHIEKFLTQRIHLAPFVEWQKLRGVSERFKNFSTHPIHLALFVAWQKLRGVSVHFGPGKSSPSFSFGQLYGFLYCAFLALWSSNPLSRTVNKNAVTSGSTSSTTWGITMLMRCWCDLDAILMRSWCDLDAILMRSWCDVISWKTSFWKCIKS